MVDLETGVQRELPLSRTATSIALNRPGDRLLVREAYAGSLVELPSGRTLGSFPPAGVEPDLGHPTPPWLALSPDASLGAAVGRDGVDVFTLPEGRVRTHLPGTWCAGLAFSPDGTELLGQGRLPSIVETVERITLGQGPTARTLGTRFTNGVPAYSADGRQLGLITPMGIASERALDTPAPTAPPPPVLSVLGVSRSGALALIARSAQQFAIAPLFEDRPSVPLEPPPGMILQSSFAADDATVVTYGYEVGRPVSLVAFHDTATGHRRRAVPLNNIYRLQSAPDGQSAAACSQKGVTILDPRGVQNIFPSALGMSLFPALYVDPTLTWVASASASSDSIARLADLPEPRSRGLLVGAMQSLRRILAFSTDGRRVLTDPRHDVPLAVLAVPSLQPIAPLEQVPPAHIQCAAFSLDGSLVAIAFDDGAILCWNAATGALRYRFEAPDDTPRTLALDPRTDRLVSIAEDRTAVVWRMSLGARPSSDRSATSPRAGP